MGRMGSKAINTNMFVLIMKWNIGTVSKYWLIAHNLKYKDRVWIFIDRLFIVICL